MAKTHTGHLLGLLKRNDVLKTKGFSLSCTQTGGIVVDRSGHVHGIWDHDGQCYRWISPSSSEPMFKTGDPRSAVLYTLVALAQG
jgi:hypothetical protein